MLYRVVLVGLLALFSCQDKEVQELKERLAAYEDVAKIEFVENSKMLGEINHSDTTEVEFIFYNSGQIPLIVEDVRASCGCTVPTWTSSFIVPGDSGKVVLRYIPKESEIGQNILKQASLATNAGPAKVNFKATIK